MSSSACGGETWRQTIRRTVFGVDLFGNTGFCCIMKITHLDVSQAHALLQSRPELVIIDVRTDEEFEMSFISGAVNFDIQGDAFEAQLGALDRSADYLIHCHSGDRSKAALTVFERLGFKHIYHMDGGMREWASQDLPHIYNYYI